jgi:hypothetical protein
MDRSTTRLGILATVLLWLASLGLPAASLACDDAAAEVIVFAVDDTPTPAPPAEPARPARAPRSPHPSTPSAPEATPAPAEAPSVPEVPYPAAAPDAPEAPLQIPAPPAMMTPRGWFGFAFEGAKYRVRPATRDSAPVWRFYGQPRISLVELGSPAARGGLQRGDVIVALDGASILTPVAGRRFGGTRPGQVVRLTVIRDGEERKVTVTAGERPERRVRMQYFDLQQELGRLRDMSGDEQMRRELDELRRQLDRTRIREDVRRQMETGTPAAQRLRYAGTIGESEVEVRGSESVIVNSDGNEMLINIGNSVVKIRTPDAPRKHKAKTPKK